MGLDMYLFARKKGTVAQCKRIKLMQWRKANAIHGFFQREFGEDILPRNYYDVPYDTLKKLVLTCDEVKREADITTSFKTKVFTGSFTLELDSNSDKEFINKLASSKSTTYSTLSYHDYEKLMNSGKAKKIYEDRFVYFSEKMLSLLPPTDGYQFGCLETDEVYIADITRTAKECKLMLLLFPESKYEFEYMADY